MPEYNFILAGRVGVGKSSLFSLIKTGIAPKYDLDDQDTTNVYSEMGLERLEHETVVNGRDVKVNLWDTGGQERYDSMTANYYRHAHAVILVYDLTAEDTLFNLTDWIKEATKNSRWSDRLVLALWGNKCDIKSNTSDEAVLAFMSSHNISLELSAKVSTRIEGSVERAFQNLIQNVDKRFNEVGTELEEETDRDTSRLTLGTDAPDNKSRCFCANLF